MSATYKIPQNVDLEDKILGPLTLKQFLYTLAAGMITFVAFSTLYKVVPALFYVITIATWVSTAAIVFVRPNDQPFTKFIYSFLWFSIKPNQRMWKRVPSLGAISLADTTATPPPVVVTPSYEEVRGRLQQLAHVVDTRGWDSGTAIDPGDRITSAAAATPVINVTLDADTEDILAAEDEARGSDRAGAELERLLKSPVAKPASAPSNTMSV